MKIVNVQSIAKIKSSVELKSVVKGSERTDTDDSEWRKWEPGKPKEIEATIISPRVAESTAACCFLSEAKKLKTNPPKDQLVQKIVAPSPNAKAGSQSAAVANKIANQRKEIKLQPSKLLLQSKPVLPQLKSVSDPLSKILSRNPNLEVQLVQPGKVPQTVRLQAKPKGPAAPAQRVLPHHHPLLQHKNGSSSNNNKSNNSNGTSSTTTSTVISRQGQLVQKSSGGVQLTKIINQGPNNKLAKIQPPKLTAEAGRINPNLKSLTTRDPPQLLRETSLNFPTAQSLPRASLSGGSMRGRPQAPAVSRGGGQAGRGRAIAIASKPSPEKLAAQLLEQNKLTIDKKQGTYRGRGRPPKSASAPKSSAAIAEGTYVAPKPPPGSDPSNGKDLPPPKALPPPRAATTAAAAAPPPPKKPPPPNKDKVAPAAQQKPLPLPKTPLSKSKVAPFPSQKGQPKAPVAKKGEDVPNDPKNNNKGGPAPPKSATIPKTSLETTKAAPTRPAPFLTRVTESGETTTMTKVNDKPKGEGIKGGGASGGGGKNIIGNTAYKCPDMDAKGFYYDKGVKFWVCLVCNKEEPEISTTPMICCDTCDDWYHFECVGIDDEPSDDESWFCKRCIVRNKQNQNEKATKAKNVAAKPNQIPPNMKKTQIPQKNKAKQPLPTPKPPKNPRKF